MAETVDKLIELRAQGRKIHQEVNVNKTRNSIKKAPSSYTTLDIHAEKGAASFMSLGQ